MHSGGQFMAQRSQDLLNEFKMLFEYSDRKLFAKC